MTNDIPIDELEKRMRPHVYSIKGFLGLAESLESVLSQDELTLQKSGISYEQLSTELSKVLLDATTQRDNLLKTNFQEYAERERSLINWEGTSIFSADNLPSTQAGFIVNNKYQVFFHQWRGFQECPWNCIIDIGWNSFDFILLNRESGNYIKAPGLIAHLIQEHHFFEGIESPYRVDPIKLATVLELISFK
jgi:hypothetical protein